MNDQSTTAFSLADLSRQAGVTPRTVRYYIAEGVLPPPARSGPGRHYGAGHLERLRLIRRLQSEGRLSLAEIATRLRRLSDAHVRGLLAAPEPPPPNSASDYLRTVLAAAAGPSTPVIPASTSRGGHATKAFASGLPDGFGRPMPSSFGDPEAGASEGFPPAYVPRTAPAFVPEPHEPLLAPSAWERIALADGLEIHARRPLSRARRRSLERLLAAVREILEEETP